MTRRIPVVTGAELVRALLRVGFIVKGQKGSHVHLRRESDSRRVTVPVHAGRDVPVGTLKGILKDAGVTTEQLIDLI